MRGHAHRGYGRGRNYVPHVSRGRVRDHARGRASDPACPHKPQRARLHTGGRVSIVYYSSLRSYMSVLSVCFYTKFRKDTANIQHSFCNPIAKTIVCFSTITLVFPEESLFTTALCEIAFPFGF